MNNAIKYYKGAAVKQNSVKIKAGSGKEYELSDCQIQYNTMKPLSDFLADEQQKGTISTKFKDPNEMKTDEKLMMQTVFTVTAPNGQEITVIIDENNMAMGTIVQTKGRLEIWFTQKGIEKLKSGNPSNLEEIVTPEQLKRYNEKIAPKEMELSEYGNRVSENELVPSHTKVLETLAEITGREIDPENELSDKQTPEETQQKITELEDELTQEELRLQLIAESAGMSVEDLKKVCQENNIPINAIKGAAEITDVTGMEEQLGGVELNYSGASVSAIRFETNNMQQRAIITSTTGETLLDDPEYDDRIVPMVPENEFPTTPVTDAKERARKTPEFQNEAEYSDADGTRKTTPVQGTKADTQVFENKLRDIMDEYKKAIQEIDNNKSLSGEARAKAKQDIAANTYASVCQLEKETGVKAQSLADEILGESRDDNFRNMVEGMGVPQMFKGEGDAKAVEETDEEYDPRDLMNNRVGGRLRQ